MHRDISEIRKANLWDSIWINGNYVGRLKKITNNYFILVYRIHEYKYKIENNCVKLLN